MVRQSVSPSDLDARWCSELTSAVNLYGATNFRTVQGVLLALTVASILNALQTASACAVTRRALARGVVCCLLVMPVVVLFPFLLVNARRDAMRIYNRFGYSNETSLEKALLACTKWNANVADGLVYKADFDFSVSSDCDQWQLYVVLLFSGAAAALVVRMAASLVYARHLSNIAANNSNRRRPHFRAGGIAQAHTPEEVAALLSRLRIASVQDLQYAYYEKQCAICLEDMSISTHDITSITRLECAHTFHETCFEKWLEAATVDTKCPMCKAPVWKHQFREGSNTNIVEDTVTWEDDSSSNSNLNPIPNVPAPSATIIAQETTDAHAPMSEQQQE